jgi:sulfur carrier protein
MTVHYRGRTYEFDRPMTVRELLKELNLSPESAFVIRGDEVLTDDDRIGEDEEVRVINAISGGMSGAAARSPR